MPTKVMTDSAASRLSAGDDSFLRGSELVQLGDFAGALKIYDAILQDDPQNTRALHARGVLTHRLGKDGGEEYIRRALSLRPDSFEGWSDLGNVCQGQGNLEEAVECFRKSLQINPSYLLAVANLALTLMRAGRHLEALHILEESLSQKWETADPPIGAAEVYNNLGTLWLQAGGAEKAVDALRRCSEINRDPRFFSNILLALNYFEEQETIYRESLFLGGSFAATAPPPLRYCHRKLRIGYVSGDFRAHPVAYFTERLLSLHDRRRFSVFCFSDVHSPDDVTTRFRRIADRWIECTNLTTEAVAAAIRHEEIDILVDLAGHTAYNRMPVFALKPATVQVSWLGYPNTTGVSAIDYRITDMIADPPGDSDRLHSEKLVRLPHGFLCYSPPENAPPAAALPAKEEGRITFGSFNNLAKITDEMLAVWREILSRVPRSTLFLKAAFFASEDAREAYLARLEGIGISRGRVVLAPLCGEIIDHLQQYVRVDVALDTFPYNGTTTTFEALWMGVPVVTLAGERHAARVGASILSRLGLENLVATDVESYIQVAVDLVSDLDALDELRLTLRSRLQGSPLCDGVRFVHDMEEAYEGMLKEMLVVAPRTAPEDDSRFETARLLFQQGKLHEAADIYRSIVVEFPDEARALHALGVIAHLTRTEDPSPWMERAVACNPDFADAWNNFGNILRDRGDSHGALVKYRTAVAVRPEFPAALANLAEIEATVGLAQEAEMHLRRAVELSPAEYLTQLGTLLLDQGKTEEGLRSFAQLLVLLPQSPEAHHNAGNACLRLGRCREAADLFRRATELDPQMFPAYNNLGLALHQCGRLDEARRALKRGAELNDADPSVWSNLGNLCKDAGKAAEAEAYFREALALNPEANDVRINFAGLLVELGRLTEALRLLEAAGEESPERLVNLGNAWLRSGMPRNAADCFRKALALRWQAPVHSNLLLSLNYFAETEEIFRESLARPAATSVVSAQVVPHERIRVGYVSPDLREHAVSFFFEPLLLHHDRTAFEIWCFSDVISPDATTCRLRRLTDQWVDCLGMTDEEVAAAVRSAEIDILVDLAGHTARNRLGVFELKPAPVQVSWLGYPNTTGIRGIDYRLTDDIADPPETTDRWYFERLERIPAPFLSYLPPRRVPRPSQLPLLQGNGPVFGSANNLAKISDETAALWGELLRRVPSARLALKGRGLDDAGCRNGILERMGALGVPPDRILLTGHLPGLRSHLSWYHSIDVAIDTFPYNGTTTTCEALWMGVPVVTLAGERHASRVGASILTSCGLPYLVAETPEEYIDRCMTLVADPEALRKERVGLRKVIRRSPLYDGVGFTKKIEQRYQEFLYRQKTQSPCAVSGERESAAFDDPFAAAARAVAEGQYSEASSLYEKILRNFPGHPRALQGLGVAMYRSGKRDDGVRLLRKAVEADPAFADCFNNLGNMLKETKRLAEAEEAYRRAIALRPDMAVARKNLALLLADIGDIEEAGEILSDLLSRNPEPSTAAALAAVRLQELRLGEAESISRRFLSSHPEDADLLASLAEVYRMRREYAAALPLLDEVIRIEPRALRGHILKATVLLEDFRHGEAETVYREALNAVGEDAVLYNNLAQIYDFQDRLEEAEAAARKAFQLKPDMVDAVTNLAGILSNTGAIAESITLFRQAVQMEPDPAAHSNLLLTMNYDPGIPQREIFEESRKWECTHVGKRIPFHPHDRSPERRIRVGYVSNDFRYHSVSYFLQPLLANHDRRHFEIFCYSGGAKPDEMTHILRSYTDVWIDVSTLSDRQLVEKIRDDRIDILVDLAGHTGGNRLRVFSCKPSPVQVTWLGYPNTTGLSSIDYRVTDGIADPPGESDLLTAEELIRLPDGFLSYTPPAGAPDVSLPPSLEAGFVTFGSFNKIHKLTAETLRWWGDIIARVPRSRLLLKGNGFADSRNRNRFLSDAEKCGIPGDRIDLFPWDSSLSSHLALYGKMDIALDTFPYNGTTTTFEALWMGVPVVTLSGYRHASRVGASILTHAGLSWLVSGSAEDYVDVAVRLAQDEEKRVLLRTSLRKKLADSSLMASEEFASKMETGYREMWRRWCSHR